MQARKLDACFTAAGFEYTATEQNVNDRGLALFAFQERHHQSIIVSNRFFVERIILAFRTNFFEANVKVLVLRSPVRAAATTFALQ